MAERWRDIPEFPGYQASSRGRVRLAGRLLTLTPRFKAATGRPDAMVTTIKIDGKPRAKLVHRLILSAFRGPCPAGQEGCHNDGNPLNNDLFNLRWDTHRENIRDAIRHGTFVKAPGYKPGSQRGEANQQAKLTEAQVRAIHARLADGLARKAIAAEFGIAIPHLSLIATGRRWAWLKPAPLAEAA